MKKKRKKYNQKFKIFGRKKGRKSVQNISTKTFDKYLVNLTTDFISKKIILDIGSGNGESTLFLSQKYPNNLKIFYSDELKSKYGKGKIFSFIGLK